MIFKLFGILGIWLISNSRYARGPKCSVKGTTGEALVIFIFFFYFFIFKLYIIVLVLPNIKMNPPQVYMCSPAPLVVRPRHGNERAGISQHQKRL